VNGPDQPSTPLPSGSGADHTVRLAWPDDAEAIAALQRRAWTEDWATGPGAVLSDLDAVFGDLAEHAARWRQTLTHSPEARFRVLVAQTSAAVAGYAVVHPAGDPDADPVRDGEIGDLAVEPALRRDGHGTRLVQAAVDTAAADGFALLRAWVGSRDDATRTLLTGGGWAADGAHRELEAPDGERIRQVRLHTQIA
jgi:ribosomal protein S18 acetylase RimI-like enzyme